jgi:uncharacterized phage protein (TIGR01671 family)
MREIKFRAWDAEVCRMYPQNGVIESMEFDKDNECVNLGICEYEQIDELGNRDYIQYNSTDFTLMQFTGLFDKNRKDIYEGDIVKLSKENRKLLGNIGIVKFKSGEFSIESPEFEHHDDIRLRKFYTHLEVIGNVCENPELLNNEIFDDMEHKTCDGCMYHYSDDGRYPIEPCCECSRFFGDCYMRKRDDE